MMTRQGHTSAVQGKARYKKLRDMVRGGLQESGGHKSDWLDFWGQKPGCLWPQGRTLTGFLTPAFFLLLSHPPSYLLSHISSSWGGGPTEEQVSKSVPFGSQAPLAKGRPHFCMFQSSPKDTFLLIFLKERKEEGGRKRNSCLLYAPTRTEPTTWVCDLTKGSNLQPLGAWDQPSHTGQGVSHVSDGQRGKGRVWAPSL